jgi:hypothetical protein
MHRQSRFAILPRPLVRQLLLPLLRLRIISSCESLPGSDTFAVDYGTPHSKHPRQETVVNPVCFGVTGAGTVAAPLGRCRNPGIPKRFAFA